MSSDSESSETGFSRKYVFTSFWPRDLWDNFKMKVARILNEKKGFQNILKILKLHSRFSYIINDQN